jgi:hypothetical protein
LGLRIVGERVKINDDDASNASRTRGIFWEKDVSIDTIQTILDQHRSDECVDDFCRL